MPGNEVESRAESGRTLTLPYLPTHLSPNQPTSYEDQEDDDNDDEEDEDEEDYNIRHSCGFIRGEK